MNTIDQLVKEASDHGHFLAGLPVDDPRAGTRGYTASLLIRLAEALAALDRAVRAEDTA